MATLLTPSCTSDGGLAMAWRTDNRHIPLLRLGATGTRERALQFPLTRALVRLANFLQQHREQICLEWEGFAATLLPAAEGLPALALRDHAAEILIAIVADLQATQSAQAQWEKSRGSARVGTNAPETAAQVHAVLRARAGFGITQLVAEFRALRAAVLRLWTDQLGVDDHASLDEVTRFNEAIDQAVAESVAHYHNEVEGARNLLMGMLGHDMRSPLNTVLVTASYLSALDAGQAVSDAAARLIRSSASLQALLDDLVDFNRIQLGLKLNVRRSEVDLAALVSDEVDQLRGAHAGRHVAVSARGDMHGLFDGPRVQQLLRNLVSNAIKYGTQSRPVLIDLMGDDDTVTIAVANHGPTIDVEPHEAIFDPLRRGSEQGDGMGLGLFIVKAITEAHRGEISVTSEDDRTVFSVRLPRTSPD